MALSVRQSILRIKKCRRFRDKYLHASYYLHNPLTLVWVMIMTLKFVGYTRNIASGNTCKHTQ